MTEHRTQVKNNLNDSFRKNKESIFAYHTKLLQTLIYVGAVVMLIPILFSPLSETKTRLVPFYVLCIVLYASLYLAIRLPWMQKRPLLGVYLVFAGTFLFATFLSVVNAPEQRATIILGMFCIFPICIIDKPWRVYLFAAGFFLLHTVLSFYCKGRALGVDDAVNCLCFLTVGLVVGQQLMYTRIEAFEAKEQLLLEKETDDLTGLKNRHKLILMLQSFEKNRENTPSGVAMLDIDDFKVYNDCFGHRAGDKLLQTVSKQLLYFETIYNIQFYRYGGDEFAAFAWGYTPEEMFAIFDSLRTELEQIAPYRNALAVCVGIADSTKGQLADFEGYIERADKAMYRAKNSGKNKVVCYDESMENSM